jgi:triosephosphate isomerase (TIM)
MENKMIFLNHKMNLNAKEIKDYLNSFPYHNNVVICPSTIYIPYFLRKDSKIGIQNIAADNSGSFTGEVSAMQAKSLGVSYAIIGHSERRANYLETDDIVNQKVLKALENHINVVLCIGEEKRKAGFEKIIKNQIKKALINVSNFEHIYIAYEPVWAIGTGLTPTNEQIKKTVSLIKETVKKEFEFVNIKVLYGGSVNDNNIEALNQIDNLDGYLIGGASLDIEKVKKIIKVVL